MAAGARLLPLTSTVRKRAPDIVSAYLRIARSRLFLHSAYAKRYLGHRRRLWRALAHYILIGERRGYRPNPFYDPAYAEAQGIPTLADYLRDPRLWSNATCSAFDPIAYRAATGADSVGPPLVDFWRNGFAAGRAPAADFDLGFFKEVVAFYRPDKEEFAFEVMSRPEIVVPRNAADLAARVKAFHAAIVFRILRRSSGARRRFLVVVQGDQHYAGRIAQAQRSYDVLLNDYRDPAEATSADYDPGVEWVTAQKGTKTTAIAMLLDQLPEVVLGYDHVLFLDDDVAITAADIDRLFATAARNGLDLAQASLTAGSCCAFAILKQPEAGPGLTPLTAVEIMMPLVSRRALSACGWVFAEAISGWAVDFLLSAEVRKRFGNTIALVGDVVVTHDREIDTIDGALYRFLRANGIEATTEAGRIARDFGIEVSAEAIRRHPDPLASAP